jgi:hypothetical protein
MSIAMDRFGLNEPVSESLASSRSGVLVFPYRLQCRSCGFEPADAIIPPSRCPKCAGGAWERFAYPRSLLKFAERRVEGGTSLRSSMAKDVAN